jgi:hypothetical protein
VFCADLDYKILAPEISQAAQSGAAETEAIVSECDSQFGTLGILNP